jgi:hypothetical protein
MGEIASGESYQNIALVTGRRYSDSQSSDEKPKHGRNSVDSGVATEKGPMPKELKLYAKQKEKTIGLYFETDRICHIQ